MIWVGETLCSAAACASVFSSLQELPDNLNLDGQRVPFPLNNLVHPLIAHARLLQADGGVGRAHRPLGALL